MNYRDHIKLRIRKLDRAIEALEDLPIEALEDSRRYLFPPPLPIGNSTTSLGIITKFVEKLKRQRARHLKLMKEIETAGEGK